MQYSLVILITTVANILTIMIIAEALLSWFLPPDHPIRAALGQILNPIYAPIRRIIPAMGAMDITPIVVLLLVQVIEQVVLSFLR